MNNGKTDASQLTARHHRAVLLSEEALGVLRSPVRGPARRPLLSSEWLISQDNLPALVMLMPSQKLHALLEQEGLEEAIEVVEWIRGAQLTEVFDYDLWSSRVGDDGSLEISSDRFLEWVRVWNEIDRDFAAARFFELEEEVLTLLLVELFEIVPKGLSEEESIRVDDSFVLTPDDRFYLKTRSLDPGKQDLLLEFVQGLYRQNLEFAARCFSYAALLIGAESKEAACRWRAGRLADQGFVAREEALALLVPNESSRWRSDGFREKLKAAEKNVVHLAPQSDESLVSELMPRLDQILQHVPDEQFAREVAQILGESRVKELTGVSEPPAYLLRSDAQLYAEVLERSVINSLQTLSQFELFELKQGDESEGDFFSHALRVLAEENPARALSDQTRLARLANSVSSLLSEPFSADCQLRALGQLRATLSLGLEKLCELDFGLGTHSTLEQKLHVGVEVLADYGVEAVFRAGLDLCFDLALSIGEALDFAMESLLLGKAGAPQAKKRAQFAVLVRSKRFSDARQDLWDIESHLDAEAVVLGRALLSRFPAVPVDGGNFQTSPIASLAALSLVIRRIEGLMLRYRQRKERSL